MSDEALRRRLRHLAANDDDHLSIAAQERVIANVLATGPGLIRRARIERIAWRAAGATLAAAAAATLWLRVGADTLGSSGPVSKTTNPPSEQGITTAPPPLRACESRGAPVNAAFRSSGEAQALDLGKIAFAVTAPGSEAVLEQSTACRTVIALHKGRVSVHARDLGGGELLVRTRDAEVAVKGTVFSVSLEGEDVAVEVAEGTVLVQKPGASVRRVTAGTRVAFAKDLVAETALASEAKQALLEATQAAPAPVPMFDADQTARADEPGRTRASENQSSDRLLKRADALRLSGDLDGARRLYREVGNGSGPSAEAAWLALARMELAAGNANAARNATLEREKRFKSGALGPEALWINVRTNRQAGNTAAARRAAEDLVRRWPKSPQAAAAKRWLEGGE
jgi:Tfp pilus assembly protein PilF